MVQEREGRKVLALVWVSRSAKSPTHALNLLLRCSAKRSTLATNRIRVEPDVLVWARSTAGFAPPDAAKRLGVSTDTLSAWEAGDLDPTVTQLRKMAKQYGRPLAVLLLPRAPTDFTVPRDFRRRDLEATSLSPELRKALRRAHTQREVFLELEDIAPTTLATSTPPPEIAQTEPAEAAGARLRAYVDVSLDIQRAFQDRYAALREWIGAIERRGILVIQTERVAIDEARGFSISEWPYPVIALNGSDAPHAKIFTLLHELAHLALNLGGLCDLHDKRMDVERRCNEIAAAALLPAQALPARTPGEVWTLDRLEDLVATFNVSSQAMMLRFVSLRRASWADYWSLLDEIQQLRDDEEEERPRPRNGGPSFYRVKARNLGRGYIRSVLDAYDSRELSAIDAIDYLDIKFSQVKKLREEAGS